MGDKAFPETQVFVYPQLCIGRKNPSKVFFVGHHLARSYLGSLLLKLLDGPFVNAATLVDEVARGGGLARVHVTDHHDVDMDLLLAHDE